MKLLIIVLSFLLIHISFAKFINKKVTRKIDISSHVVKATTTITAENAGDDSIYVFNIDSGYEDSVSFIGAMVGTSFIVFIFETL